MVLLLGHSEDGRGQWEREGSSAGPGLWNECVPEKATCGSKAVCFLYDPTGYHLCFSESWIRLFFQISGVFFGIRRKILPD